MLNPDEDFFVVSISRRLWGQSPKMAQELVLSPDQKGIGG